MSPRYDLDFKILSGRNPFLRASPGSKLLKLMGVMKGVLQTFVTAINNAYDARFISTASGEGLDKHGVTLDLPRNAGESDDDYRDRLLTEFQDIPVGLTVQSIKDAVNQVMGPGTGIDEYYKSIWEWPKYSAPSYSLFGNNNIGASSAARAADTKVACRFQISSDGAVQVIRAYLSGAGGSRTAYAAIYEDDSGAPKVKLADADASVNITAPGWYTFDFANVQLAAGSSYWLCINVTGGGWNFYYGSGTVNQAAYNVDTPPPDDPFGTANYEDRSYSIYAPYIIVDSTYSWQRPFNLTLSRYYASAIIGTEPTENELDQIEENVIQKKPANRIIRIVKEEVGYYNLYREIE